METSQIESLRLDETDREIVQHLTRDGRMPYREIGELVGLSEAAVRQRTHRLRERGAIEIVAVVNPLIGAPGESATIGVSTDGQTRAAAEAISSIPQVGYAVITAGSFDIIAEVHCAGRSELLDVASRIRASEHVVRSELFVILEFEKLVYNHFLPDPVSVSVRTRVAPTPP